MQGSVWVSSDDPQTPQNVVCSVPDHISLVGRGGDGLEGDADPDPGPQFMIIAVICGDAFYIFSDLPPGMLESSM
jgi:hypothetical protein